MRIPVSAELRESRITSTYACGTVERSSFFARENAMPGARISFSCSSWYVVRVDALLHEYSVVLEVEQGPRRNRHDELVGQRGFGHAGKYIPPELPLP